MEVREQVRWFSEQMELKLQENDHKGGWDGCGIYELIYRLQEETGELLKAVNSWVEGEPVENIIEESADVANFAMMIADITRKYLVGDSNG